MKLLIKFPTRNRKDKFFKVLDLYYKNLNDSDNTIFLITCDHDDKSMNNENVIEKLKSYKNLTVVYGNSESKIHAVNRDMEEIKNYDILLLASDDMTPVVKGYDDILRDKMKEYYQDTDGVLWFNDGYQGKKLNTLCILGKKYYDRFNYIYYPEYKSGWCDNEFMEVSKLLNKCTYFDDVIIRHEHPDWGFGDRDEIHSLNYRNLSHDKNLYLSRVKINFEL